MSSGCCDDETANNLAAGERRKTLYAVLWINALMFAGELTAGILVDSKALIADSADNLGDTLVYVISLFVVARSLRWRAGAAFAKGLIQLAFGIGIVASIVASLLGERQPIGPAMMAVAGVALIGNLICFALLMKHRGTGPRARFLLAGYRRRLRRGCRVPVHRLPGTARCRRGVAARAATRRQLR